MELIPKSNLAAIATYKPGRPIEEVARELGLTGDIIKLASNENPIGPSPMAVQAVIKALSDSQLYPDDNCYYLKQELAQRLEISPEELVVGNGSVEILPWITLAYINPEENAVVSAGAFIWFKIAVGQSGGHLIEVPMRDGTHDLEAMADAVNDKTKVVFVANPNNPTGTIVSADEVDRFMSRVPPHVLVVMDEAYYEYIKADNYPKSFKYFREGRNIIILRTFSKIYGLAGIRLGHGITQKTIAQNLMKMRISFNANRLAQVAGLAAIDDIQHVHDSIETNEAGKAFLYKEYDRLGLRYYPTFANFIFVDFDQDSRVIFEGLQRRGVIARTIKEYGFPNALRITIGTPDQNRRLIRAIEEVLQG
jgi:histidinol-phosphate aminotransferase